MEGRRVASKRLGPLPRMKWAALGHGCGREGSGALPLPRAAAVSTGLRVRAADAERQIDLDLVGDAAAGEVDHLHRLRRGRGVDSQPARVHLASVTV